MAVDTCGALSTVSTTHPRNSPRSRWIVEWLSTDVHALSTSLPTTGRMTATLGANELRHTTHALSTRFAGCPHNYPQGLGVSLRSCVGWHDGELMHTRAGLSTILGPLSTAARRWLLFCNLALRARIPGKIRHCSLPATHPQTMWITRQVVDNSMGW